MNAIQIIKWRPSLVALILCLILASSCVSSNNSPVINKLQPEKDRVTPSSNITIVCVASDTDRDKLSYQWVATKGNISGQGPTVTWTAPKACGNYVITVTVADGRGGEASQELTIKVKKPG